MSDSERLAAEWTKAQRQVGAYICALVPDFHQAEDVLQRVAVTVAKKFDQYDPSRPFLPWAVGIAKIEVREHRRQLAADRHVFADNLVVERVAESFQEMADELDHSRRALRECLQIVAGRALRALQLRYLEERNIPTIADSLGMNPGAVRVMLHRTRNALRDCIERRLRAWGD